MTNQIRKHQMHYGPEVKGVWSGFGSDLNPLCGQPEQILITSVTEAVDCLKCVHIMERPSGLVRRIQAQATPRIESR